MGEKEDFSQQNQLWTDHPVGLAKRKYSVN
jgi:hypothetical protein